MQRCLRLPLFVALLFCFSTSLLTAQNIMRPDDSLVNYDAGAPAGSVSNPLIPPDGKISKWIRTSYGVPTDQFKAYIFNGMAFRVRFPNNYDPANTSKYPVVVFFHGQGETEKQWDNENQLYWGALVFEERMNKGDWNGFLLFPQESPSFGEWNEGYFNRINTVIDTLQKYNNADGDRVISVGASSGGFACLYYAGLHAYRVAAAISCSAVRIEGILPLISSAKYLPTWIESGGSDLGVTPGILGNYNKAFRAAGGNLYSTLYQASGHFLTDAGQMIWSEQWNMKNKDGDFISTDYFNNAHKAQPVILSQNNQICIAGGTLSTTLGISGGYAAYEWQMNNITVAGAAANEYTVTQPGTYRVRFKRTSAANWSAWSPKPIVIASPNCATDTLYAEHFNIEPKYTSSNAYALGNVDCLNGILTNSTETFTTDATGVLGGGFLGHFTTAGSACSYNAGDKVWGTANPIAVKPNTAYEFVFFLGNQSANSPAKIAATVNGNVLSGDFVSASGIGNPSWTKYVFTWNSGNESTANLGLINNNTDSEGNDFMLDEISFRPVPPPIPTCVTNIAPADSAVVASGTNVLLSWNAAPGAASYDVYLTGGAMSFPDTALANASATTYNAIGLKEGSQYKFYVVPKNADGAAVGCQSNATTFTVAAMPPAPSCVVNALPANASILPSQTSARLVWPASASATSYDVYLAAGNAVPTLLVTNTNALTYYATNLTPGTLYSWYVAPKNTNGAAAACGAANTTTFTTAAAMGGANLPPMANGGTNITITLPVTTTLNGTASYDPDGSIIEYYWYQVQGPVTATLGNFTATPAVTGLTTAGTYIFGLQVKDNNGMPGYSQVTVVVNPAGTPPAPACVTNTSPAAGAILATQSTATLTWPSSATATSYDVYLAAGTGTPTVLVTNTAALTYNASGLTAGTLYSWWIAPVNASGANTGCATSNVSTFTTAAGTTALPACVTNAFPVNGSVLPSQTSARLTWPASADATSYDVYLAAGNTVPTLLVINTAALTYNATGLTAGTLYSWYVAPKNANGAAAACGAANTTTFTTAASTGGANLPPMANGGTNITITLPVSAATMNGTASYDPDGSIVEYYWYQVQGPVTATLGNFTATPAVTGLTTTGTYVFGLQVKDNNGVNAYSQVTVVVNPAGTPPTPACVTNTSPAAGTTLATRNTATLTWPSSATATSYDVYLAAGTGTPTVLVTNTAALTYNASGLTAGTLYSWWIAPVNASGANTGCATSNVSTFTTAAGTAALPACVTNTFPVNGSVLPSQTSARLTWPASADATSYDVYLAADNAVPILLRANTTALTYYATGLTAGTLYSWYIAPGNANGAAAACGAANTTTFTTAAATGGANLPPVANGGTNITITLPVSTATLDGTASYDPDGSIIEYYWYQVQGPVTVTLNNFTATPTVTGLTTAGTYIFGLQVKDNNGVPGYSQVTVTVKAADALRMAAVTRSPANTTADRIYPNPLAPGQSLNMVIGSERGGMAIIQILSATGNIIHTEKLAISAGMNTKTIHTAQLAQGLYIIHVSGDVNKESNLKLVVE